jgi:hypothetical protein
MPLRKWGFYTSLLLRTSWHTPFCFCFSTRSWNTLSLIRPTLLSMPYSWLHFKSSCDFSSFIAPYVSVFCEHDHQSCSYRHHRLHVLRVYEEYCLLGYNAVQPIESEPTFRRNISEYSSTLKMEAICYSEVSLDILHGSISQKIVLFITTAVRTSNPTKSSCLRYYLHNFVFISSCFHSDSLLN